MKKGVKMSPDQKTAVKRTKVGNAAEKMLFGTKVSAQPPIKKKK